jgi:hypothetical protein
MSTQEILHQLTKYPNLAKDLLKDIDKPPFSIYYQPETIEIFTEELPLFKWYQGEVKMALSIDPNYPPETIEVVVDGEEALVIVNNKIYLDRISHTQILECIGSPYVRRKAEN